MATDFNKWQRYASQLASDSDSDGEESNADRQTREQKEEAREWQKLQYYMQQEAREKAADDKAAVEKKAKLAAMAGSDSVGGIGIPVCRPCAAAPPPPGAGGGGSSRGTKRRGPPVPAAVPPPAVAAEESGYVMVDTPSGPSAGTRAGLGNAAGKGATDYGKFQQMESAASDDEGSDAEAEPADGGDGSRKQGLLKAISQQEAIQRRLLELQSSQSELLRHSKPVAVVGDVDPDAVV
jgi:hypothetical protein